MLGAKADVDGTGMANYTPLFAAAVKGHVDVAEALLNAGAAVNHTSTRGETPLLLAAEADSVGVIELLLARGADVHHTTTFLATAAYVHTRARGTR
jgi:ankyrin repeat protein